MQIVKRPLQLTFKNLTFEKSECGKAKRKPVRSEMSETYFAQSPFALEMTNRGLECQISRTLDHQILQPRVVSCLHLRVMPILSDLVAC